MNDVSFALLLVILVHESYNVAGQNRCGKLTIDYIHTGQTVSANIYFNPSKTLEIYSWIHKYPGASTDFDFDQTSRQNSGKYHLSENPISILIKDINPSDDGLYYIECMLSQGIVSVSENGMNIHRPYTTASATVPLPEEIDKAVRRDKRNTDDYYYNYGESETTEMPTGHGSSDYWFADYGMPESTENSPISEENVPVNEDYVPVFEYHVPEFEDYVSRSKDSVPGSEDYAQGSGDYVQGSGDEVPGARDDFPHTTQSERRSTDTAERTVFSENITTIQPEAKEKRHDITPRGEDGGIGDTYMICIIVAIAFFIILVIGLTVFLYKKTKRGEETTKKDNLQGQKKRFPNDTRSLTFHNGVYSTGVNFNTKGTLELKTFAVPKMNEGQDGYDRMNYQQSRIEENIYINTNKSMDIERPKYDDYENWDPKY